MSCERFLKTSPLLLQALADKKKNVTDEDVLALVGDEVHQPEKLWDLLGLQVGFVRP